MNEKTERKQTESFNDESSGSLFIGFLFGFFLPIFGVFIAFRGKKENTITGALVGLVLFVICFAIFIVLLQCNVIRLGPPPVAD